MKRKLFGLSFIFIMILTFLTGCSGMGFKVTGVRDVSSPIIDPAHRAITFQVANNKDTFDFDDILVTEGVVIEGYKEEELLNKLDPIVKLEVGINEFYVRFSLDAKSIVWRLSINRLPIEKPIKLLNIKELKNEYKKNEEFVPGILYVEYQEGSYDEVVISLDMVSGFETKRLGEKHLTISYMNEKIDYIITVYPEDDQILTGIEVIKPQTTYYKNQGFMGGTLRLSYGRDKMDILLKESMVSGFDTYYAGKRTIYVNYGGLSTSYEIEILDIAEVASVYSFTTLYEKNGEYIPGLLKLERGNEVEFIEITKDMLEGSFDTSTVGTKYISIRYGNSYLNQTINVIENINDKPNIVENYLDDYTVRDLIKTFIAVSHINSSKFSDSDLENERAKADKELTYNEISLCMKYLKNAGLNQSDLYDIERALRYDISYIMKLIYQIDESGINSITRDNISKVKEIAANLVAMLETSEYAMLIPENIEKAFNDNYYLLYSSEEKKQIEIKASEISKLIFDKNLEEFVNKQFKTNLGYKERAYFVEFAKSFLNTFNSIDSNTLYELAQIDYDNFFMDLPNNLSTINSLGDNLAKILGNKNTISMLNVFAKEYANATKEFKNEGMLSYEYVMDLSDNLVTYSMDFAKLLSKLSLDDLKAISNLGLYIDSEKDIEKANAVYGAIKISKRLEALAIKLEDDGNVSLIDKIILGPRYTEGFGRKLVSEIKALAHYKEEGLPTSKIKELHQRIKDLFNIEEPMVNIEGSPILLKSGASIYEFNSVVKKNIEIYDIKNDMYVSFNLDMVMDKNKLISDLNNPGLHYVMLNINGRAIRLNYLAIDSGMTISLLTPRAKVNISGCMYLSSNLELLKLTDGYNKGEVNDSLSLSEYLDNYYFNIYIEDLGMVINVNPDDLSFKPSYIVDTTLDGVNIGALKLDTDFGELYIPMNYVIIKDTHTVDYNNTNVVVEGMYSKDFRFSIDYGYDYLDVNVNEDDIKGFIIGNNIITRPYNDGEITLEIIKMSEAMANLPIEITNIDGSCYYNDNNTFKYLNIEFMTYLGMRDMTYSEFCNYLNEAYSLAYGYAYVYTYLENINYDTMKATLRFEVSANYNSFNFRHDVNLMTEECYRSINVKYDSYSYNLEVEDSDFDKYRYKYDYELENMLNDRINLYGIDSASSMAYGEYKQEGLFNWLNNNYISYTYDIKKNNDYIIISLKDMSYKSTIISMVIVKKSYNQMTSSASSLSTVNNNTLYLSSSDFNYGVSSEALVEKLISEQLKLNIYYKYTKNEIKGKELYDFLISHKYKLSGFKPDLLGQRISISLLLDDGTSLELNSSVMIVDLTTYELKGSYYHKYKLDSASIKNAINNGLFKAMDNSFSFDGYARDVEITDFADYSDCVVTYEAYGYTMKLSFRSYRIYDYLYELGYINIASPEGMDRNQIINSLYVKHNDGMVIDINLDNELTNYVINGYSTYIDFYRDGYFQYRLDI